MQNEFYYLDGAEKRGPYTLEEIVKRNLPGDTLIFIPNKNKWEKLSEIDLEPTNDHPEIKREEDVEERVDDEKTSPLRVYTGPDKRFIFLCITIISILLTGISVFIHIKLDKGSLESRIEKMMLQKKVICDYQYYEPKGELMDIYPCSADLHQKMLYYKFGGGKIEPEVTDSVLICYNNIYILIRKDEQPVKYNFYKKFVEFFFQSSGGLKIYTLVKTTNGFDIINCKSNNYAYLIREKEYDPILERYAPTYRPNVRTIHQNVINSYIGKYGSEPYIENSKTDILNVPHQKSLFFELKNIQPSDNNEFGGSTSKWSSWHTDNSHGEYLEDSIINEGFYPYSNGQFVVWVRDEGLHYEYCLIVNTLLIFSGIYMLVIFTIIFTTWKLFYEKKYIKKQIERHMRPIEI
jgi:hypothetical protein